MRKARVILARFCVLLSCIGTAAGGSVPPGTSIDNQASASYQASSGQSTSANSNVVHVITQAGGAALSITKSASTSTANPGDQLTYTLKVDNAGGDAVPVSVVIDGSAAAKVIVRDVIPNNTTFSSFVSTGGAIPVYHAFGSPLQTYVSVAPPNLSTVDAVAFALDTFAGGASGSFSFNVTVDANASGTIRNTAVVYFNNGSDTSSNSNEVDVTVSGPAPKIAYYFDKTFAKTIQVTAITSPLFVQVDAAACNLDPTVAETHPVAIKSTLTGDTESFVATETGPNTGIFRVLPEIPVRDGSTNPVVSGNQIVETLHNDKLTATLAGCGGSSVSAVVLVDPEGVVFDSRSNAPVGGATVTLIDVTGAGNGGSPNGPATVFQFDGTTPAPNPVITGSNGQFQFPLVLPSTYRIAVAPPVNYTFPSAVAPGQLPPGRNVDPAASYNGAFVVNTSTLNFDVPVDTSASTAIFIQKLADRSIVEQGDFLNYTLEIKNLTSAALPNVLVSDTLPPGFIYELKTARLNGVAISDPAGGRGPSLTFNIGTLAANADVKLTYRVFVGPGSGTGDAVNRASAASGSLQSNIATAKVRVQGGVFSDNGFIVGKVFQDCNRNRMQDRGERGIPGVRLYLDDGTFAITDEAGKYSIYGVPGRTHILKVDKFTLPYGSKLVAISNRNAGDGGSLFIDLKFGEMKKADFAVSDCSPALATEIDLRKQRLSGNPEELAQAVKAQFHVEDMERNPAELKALAASGYVEGSSPVQPGAQVNPAQFSGETKTARLPDGRNSVAQNKIPAALSSVAGTSGPEPAELSKLDNQLGFVDLHDHDVLPFAQTNIRVKGMLGNSFKLVVNGAELSTKQVGNKTTVATQKTEIWEFIGVNLRAGKNAIELSQLDPWGNNRGSQQIEVIAPSDLGKLKIETARGAYAADGRTPVKVVVLLTDARGVPVTVRTPITLETNNGVWLAKDVDAKEPGTQVFIEGGRAEFDMMSPLEPGSASIRASSGGVHAEKKIEFVPELRPMLAAGLVEYQVNFGGLSHSAIQPSLNDGFEHQLQLVSAENANGTMVSGGHVALLLKGKIKGENLLTLAYDSDKASGDRLFRDIQPDQYYPVYGDSSVRGYDAQSTTKAYVRIDHGRTYLLYGDYLTAEPGAGNSLGNYSRSMTGVKEHYENGRVNLTGFTSYDSLRQVVDEFPANGTSGPFTLSNPNGIENSEKVEILVRDRNQPAVIVDVRPLARFADYEFEPFTGQLLLKLPVPTLDPSFNLNSIRITYEINQGGERFWVGGGTAQIKFNNRLQVGGTFVKDSNPQDSNQLFAINAGLKLDENTALTAELAGTDHASIGSGLGYRLELQHDGARFKAKSYFARTDANFDNPTSFLNKGRGEGGVKASYAFNPTTRLLGEVILTEDVNNGGTRQGGDIVLEKSLPRNTVTSFGFRHVEEGTAPASATSLGITPNTINTVISKISWQVPHLSRVTANGEFEQDVSNIDKHVVAVGGAYQFWAKGKVYFRQELISSLGDVYSLNSFQHRSTTQIGIDSTYYKDAHVFSEYRVRDLSNGREAEAAIGLRNTWNLAKGLAINSGVESIRTLNGTSADSLALTGALEYTAHPNWKSSARMEWRGSTTTNSILNTIGFAAKLSDTWTFLGRNVLSTTTTKGTSAGSRLQDRLQFGFALRDATRNRWNALNLFELKADHDGSQPLTPVRSTIGIFSMTANYQVRAPLTLSGRYAAKWSIANDSNLASSATMQMAGGRATWDVTRRWDVGFAASTKYSVGFNSKQYGMGFETGYRVFANMWLSTGYNVVGFRDTDLTGEDITRRGAFVRMRFKFDESTFARNAGMRY